MKKSFIVLTTFISLLATLISGPMSPANADPLADDASITALTFGSPNYYEFYGRRDTAALYPSFSSNKYNYQLVTVADILDVNAVLSDPLATMRITFDGVSGDAQSAVPYRISMKPKVSMLDIVVTAQDGVTSRHYKVNVSNQILQAPEIISMSSNSGPWTGGKPITFRVKNAILTNGNGESAVNCFAQILFTITDPVTGAKSVVQQYFGYQASNTPDENGITEIGTVLSTRWDKQGFTGEAKVSMNNHCYGAMRGPQQSSSIVSESAATHTFTYLPVEITDVVTPNTITGSTFIEVKGTNLYPLGDLSVELLDVASGQVTPVYKSPSQSDATRGQAGSWRGFVNREDRQTAFSTAGKKLLRVGYWNYDPTLDTYEWVNLFSRTVNWKPTLPSAVVISPAKSDISGGKRIRVEGFDICNQNTWPQSIEVKIDGKPLTNIQMQDSNQYCGDTGGWESAPIKQWITGLVPEGTSTGIKDVTIDNGNGPVKVSATFTYGATPTITSISPSSVASTGGSKVRITGNNFGFSGTPTVIIGGKKSPKVTLVSDTQLDVIVPFDLAVGNQSVSVVSSSGGGANTAPVSITVVAPTQNPTVTSFSSSQGLTSGGDVVTISVGNIATPTSVGVMFGINPAEVTRATASQIDVKVPAGTAGTTSVTLSSALGQVVVTNAYTYNPIAAVRSVSPSKVASTADEAGRTVTFTGIGFGASGTIKVGQQAAKPYTSTEAGTKISSVVIPNDVAGSLAVLITPSGSLVPLATSVTVTRPKISYIGPEVESAKYNIDCALNDWNCVYGYDTKARPSLSKFGGDVLKIKGTGFGSAGTVKFGNQTINPSTYSDTEILVTIPALAIGEYDLTVVPSSGLQTEIRYAAFSSVEASSGAAVGIIEVVPTVPNTRGDELYNFHPALDASSVFAVSGYGFLGDDNGASTKVYQLQSNQNPLNDGEGKIKVTILSITDTRITFSAVRTFVPIRWTGLAVETSETLTYVSQAIRYVGTEPPRAQISGWYGLCTKDAIKTHNPAVVTVTGSGMFGASGTVTLSGQPIDSAAVTWTTDSVSVDFSKLPADLAERWGQKTLEYIPTDTTFISRTFNWFCGVWAEVETKINGSTENQSISAGDNLVATADIPAAKRLNEVVPQVSWPSDGYQYQSATDHARNLPWTYNVRSGLPTYAGDWYVRANPGTSTPLIDRGIYAGVSSSEVRVTINGTPITFTPKLKNSTDTTITYRGQLGDGTNDSSEDISYTVDLPAGAPAITKIVWEYRNNACALSNNDWNWSEGLPANVAVIPNQCGGDGSATSSWDIRVKSFEMIKDGKDQAMFYLPTFNTFNLTIAKRALTIDKVVATKPFDGNGVIYLGALTVSGAIDGETPTLQGNDTRKGYFADATVGDNKPVYVSGSDGQTDFIQRIKLEGAYGWNYYLTNSELLVLGSITKANARLSISATNLSLVMSVVDQSTISTSVIDTTTGNAPIADAAISAVDVTVSTPSVCSISSQLVVTAVAPGECIVQASQAASTNYNAASAVSDPDSNIETLTINVFAEPKKVSVITQDLIVAQGEAASPTFEAIGLTDGDSVNAVVFEYFDGASKLDQAPTEPGRYTMIASTANIVATNLASYDLNIEFVAGLLLITSPPPTVTGMTPTSGPQAGGGNIVITGTNLAEVTSIKFGEVVIPNTSFVVNGDGTEISFVAPAGTGNVSVVLTAGESQLSRDYFYDPTVATITDVAPTSGSELGKNIVVVTGTHLELVTEVRFGSVTLSSASLTRSVDGTTISFAAPAGTGKVNILLVTSSGNSSFQYTYTPIPSVISTVTGIAPATGYTVGGNIVVVTGTHLELVTEVRFGGVVIASASLVRSPDGTSISFAAPAGIGKVTVTLASPTGDSSFDYTYKLAGNPDLLLNFVNPDFGEKLAGQRVKMTASELKPGATYTLNMFSKKVSMVTGTVSPDGSINGSMLIPEKACVAPGLHKLILESEDEAGKKYRSTVYVVLGTKCILSTTAEKLKDGSWKVRGIRFDYKKWDLTNESKATVAALKPWLKSAAKINVSGYTETDGKGLPLKKANKVLAHKRALEIVNSFKNLGAKNRFFIDPAGAKNPISSIQAKNRRVELRVRF